MAKRRSEPGQSNPCSVMSTHPYEHQREDEHKVGGEDDQEVHRGIPGDGVYNIWGVRGVTQHSRNPRSYENRQERPEVFGLAARFSFNPCRNSTHQM